METSKIMDIFAYFLSEYDMEAVKALGYETQIDAFNAIAEQFGKKGSYLRRLRDEYDVVTSSPRRGQCNRPPRQRIVETKNYLSQFSFDELLELTKTLMSNANIEETHSLTIDKEYDARELMEEEIENVINFKDPGATVKRIVTSTNQRVYDTSIIEQLKKLYGGKCQICGEKPFDADICEVHHIEYFSRTHNNDASNLALLCPNHHRMIHKYNPKFEKPKQSFVFDDGKEEKIILNYHLSE